MRDPAITHEAIANLEHGTSAASAPIVRHPTQLVDDMPIALEMLTLPEVGRRLDVPMHCVRARRVARVEGGWTLAHAADCGGGTRAQWPVARHLPSPRSPFPGLIHTPPARRLCVAGAGGPARSDRAPVAASTMSRS